MKIVEVKASGQYQVLIGSGLLAKAGELLREVSPKAEKAAIISDDTVDELYGQRVENALTAAGYETAKYVLPHGEESKNGFNYIKILNFLANSHLTRSDVLVALGGGMVGDMAGFAAASYLRGIKYVQIPTTLLADVDSSVGGKTAIDLDAGKNLAGAFCQPARVICDYDTLQTLTKDIFTDGCAEVIKYGVLGSEELFAHLEERGADFDTEYVLEKCVAMKRDYVCADEFDNGERRKLNLGHTLGHAVEAESEFALSHGKSVAIGLASVARASAKAGICSEECAGRICALLEKFGLPTKTDYDMDALYEHMLSDKKRLGGTVNLIVPEKIGVCSVLPMKMEQAREFMKAGL
jgi:3-dehydroquinate synthase